MSLSPTYVGKITQALTRLLKLPWEKIDIMYLKSYLKFDIINILMEVCNGE
jgi:hypothetical protein